MKKTIMLSYIALLVAFGLPVLVIERDKPHMPEAASPTEEIAPVQTQNPFSPPPSQAPEQPAPESLMILEGEQWVQTNMQEYLVGVVAAEMPASFDPEALKAQAVAARSYAIYTAESSKHGKGQVCTDYRCCQAWNSPEQMKEKWGENYDLYEQKIREAVEATAGEYLCYQGEAVFAAFHSSSAGATEDSGQLWAQLPYLVSVESPETEADVPNYISSLSLSALDFRDSLLHAHPEADFTGEESTWIGQISRDGSGRVETVVLGGVEMKGTELRSLFNLRSTAFELEYKAGGFVFTVTGYGHGVGMSQYGANVMARQGEGYRDILAHYYPGTELAGA